MKHQARTTIQSIFICEKRGGVLISLPSVEAVAGCGLEGDRWHRPNDPITAGLRWLNAKRKGVAMVSTNISIITSCQIKEGNAALASIGESPFTPIQMRRNIVLDGNIDLNQFAPDACCERDYDRDGYCDIHTTGNPIGKEFTIGSVRLVGSMFCNPCTVPPGRSGKLKGREQMFKQAFATCGGLRARILTGGTLCAGDVFGFTSRN